MLDGLTNAAPAVNAISTVVLVIVTGVYAYLTWGMVRETRRARKQEVMPVMNLDVEPFAIGAWAPKIENVGNGPAIDVTGTVQFEPGGEEHEIQSKNIPAGDFTGSLDPKVHEESHEKYDSMTVTGEYTTVFGDTESFEESYDLELLAKLDGAESMMKRDWKERYLQRVEQHLRSLAGGVEVDGLQKVLNIESRSFVLDELRDHGPLTVAELASRTGLTHFELGEDLMWLCEAGAVEYDIDRDEIIQGEHADVEIRLRDEKGER